MYRDASLLQEVRKTGRLIKALTIFVRPPKPRTDDGEALHARRVRQYSAYMTRIGPVGRARFHVRHESSASHVQRRQPAPRSQKDWPSHPGADNFCAAAEAAEEILDRFKRRRRHQAREPLQAHRRHQADVSKGVAPRHRPQGAADRSLLQEVRKTGRLIKALTIFVRPPKPRRRSSTDSSADDEGIRGLEDR
jgi:hypothetical protein